MNVHHVRVDFDATQAKAEARAFDNSMDRLDSRAGGLTSTFKKMAGIMGAIGFGLAAADMARTVIETERMKASLTTMTGSMENANAAFEALQHFASTTPFTVDQSVNAFVKMKSLGLEPTAEALTSFGNTASAMGKDLNQMIEAVADASTMEFERLKEFGIKARQTADDVTFTFQGVETTVAKNSKEIVGYLQKIGAEKFGDAMEQQMARLPGKLSNLRDNIQNLWRALGDAGVTEALGNIVTATAGFIEKMTTMITTGFAQENISIILAGWVLPFTTAFGVISEEWAKRQGEMVEASAQAAAMTAEDMLTWTQLIQAAITTLPVTFMKGWQIMTTSFLAFIEIMGEYVGALSDVMEVGWAQIGRGFELLWENSKLIFVKFISWLGTNLQEAMLGIADNLPDIGMFGALKNALQEAAVGMDSMAGAEARLRAEMAASELAHADKVDTLFNEAKAHKDTAAAMIQALQDTVVMLGQEDQAFKKLTAERILAAQALLTNVKAGKSWKEILAELSQGQEVAAATTEELTKAQIAHQKAQEALEKKLQPYLDKIRGISEAEREEIEILTLLGQAMALGIIDPATEAIPLLEALRAGLKDTAEEAMTWETAMKRSVERLDDVFGNMWQDFVKTGTASFSTLLDGFKSFLGEMNHSMVTQPIMVELKNAANGEAIDWDKMGKAALAGLGQIGGTMLGGGGEGAAMGASLGGLLALTPLGPIGGLVGSLVGGLVGGMFDSDPQLKLSGAGYKQRSTSVQTELGGFTISGGNGGVSDIRRAAMETIGEMDKAIAEFLGDDDLNKVTAALNTWNIELKKGAVSVENIVGSRLDTIVGALESDVQNFVNQADKFEDRMTRLVLALQAKEVMADNPELFGDAVLGDFLGAVELLAVRGKSAEAAISDLVEAMAAAAVATEILADYTNTDLVEAYTEAADLAGRTVREKLLASGDAVREALGDYDETATSVQNIADAVRARYQLEFDLLAQLDSVAAAVSDRFENLRNSIEEFISPKSIDDYTAQLDALFAQLSVAVDPAEIDKITQDIEAVARAGWNSLPDDMKQAMGQQFIDVLNEADSLAQERLGLIRDQVVSESAILRDQVGELMVGITDPFHLVINDLGLAAELLISAGENLGGTREPGDDFGAVGGGRDKGGQVRPNSVDAGLTVAANTLTNEGAAYRQATTAMITQVTQAIASIPGRIVVKVEPQKVSQYV